MCYLHHLCTLSLVKCFDFSGNGTVLWILLRRIRLKTMTDVSLLNLALSDLVLSASLPLWAINSHDMVTCKLVTGVYQVGVLHLCCRSGLIIC